MLQRVKISHNLRLEVLALAASDAIWQTLDHPNCSVLQARAFAPFFVTRNKAHGQSLY